MAGKASKQSRSKRTTTEEASAACADEPVPFSSLPVEVQERVIEIHVRLAKLRAMPDPVAECKRRAVDFIAHYPRDKAELQMPHSQAKELWARDSAEIDLQAEWHAEMCRGDSGGNPSMPTASQNPHTARASASPAATAAAATPSIPSGSDHPAAPTATQHDPTPPDLPSTPRKSTQPPALQSMHTNTLPISPPQPPSDPPPNSSSPDAPPAKASRTRGTSRKGKAPPAQDEAAPAPQPATVIAKATRGSTRRTRATAL